uniref:uncharacterized protein n=1 Tax=Pristiophorus japonicus TaxID=55135 RepID=UPI00398F382E
MFPERQEAQTQELLPCDLSDGFSTPQCLKAHSRVKGSLPVTEDQDLKVYLRVRPFLKAELANDESKDCVIIEDSETVVLEAPKHSTTMKNSERGIGQAVHKFTFSQIFGQETSQKAFFDGTVKDLVKQYLQGQNSLVFTYGVTNAGKTYTIQGTAKDGGILPRSLDMLFDHIKGRQYQKMDLKPHIGDEVLKLGSHQTWQEEAIKAAIFSTLSEETECRPLRMTTNKSSPKNLAQPSSITPAVSVAFDQLEKHSEVISRASDTGLADQRPLRYSVWVSFCEIYNECVYDLLDVVPTLKSQKRQNLRVCEDQKGNSYIKDLKWINITSSDEAFKFLKIGNKNRSLASTKINQQSSRSHSIFSIQLMEIIGDDKPHVIRTSELSLCDLAGSERCDKAQTFGDRLKEAGNINNSLLILGKCISALRQKQQNKLKQIVVPFRESKLTRLFQAFFCGKGKACIIININQCASMYDETLHVMKFSAIAKQMFPIRPKVNLQLIDPIDGSNASMMVCTDLRETLTAENCFSEDLLIENEELDFSTLGHEELLGMIENLKQTLIAERQHKLVLEIRVRKEMGEAMFHQLLRTEEVWSERFEELKEIYEEQLDSKLHLYKESIRRHAYKCALEEVQYKCVSKEMFTDEQSKVKKLSHNKRETTRTGGGPANLHPLTPLEERATAFMGPAWRRTISTAQAGPTREGVELEDNPPDDPNQDSDVDEPEEESNLPEQHGHKGHFEGFDDRSVLLNLEVNTSHLPGSSVISGSTFYGFPPSEVAGPGGGGVPQHCTPMAPPSEVTGPSSNGAGAGANQQGTPGVPRSQPASPSGMLRRRSRGRGRRHGSRAPEMQDATDVVQMMALGGESVELTRSLLDTITGVNEEVAGLSGEVTVMAREIGTMSANISEGMVAMRDGMSEVVERMTVAMTKAMREGMSELAAAIREHAQTPCPLTESTATPTPIAAPSSEQAEAMPSDLPPGPSNLPRDVDTPPPSRYPVAEMLERRILVRDSKVEELTAALSKYQSQPALVAANSESITGLLEELAWFKEEVSNAQSRLQSLQLEAVVNENELNRYKELYKSKVISEEQSAKLLEQKDQVTRFLTKEICTSLQEAEKKYQESNEELKKLNWTITKQEKMFKEVEEEHVGQINQLQDKVSKLQEELTLATKLSNAERPPQMKKRLFANLTGSKLAVGSPSKTSLFKSRELTPRLKVKKNAVSGKFPSLPSKAHE